jgi:glycosyltransferase involved in cell wall biosynthesis
MVDISVIITNYNNSQYLSECLDSVFSQTDVNFECIIVDDNSTDDSLTILESYASLHQNLILIKKHINEGCGQGRCTGLKYGSGKYVIFLDSDDYYTHQHYLKFLFDKAESTDSDIVRSGYSDITGEHIEHDDAIIIDRQERIDAMLNAWGKSITSICNTMYNRTIWQKTYYSERPAVEDTPSHVRALMIANQIAYVEDYGYYYRTNPNSITHNLYPAKFQLFNILCMFDCLKACKPYNVKFICDERGAYEDFKLNAIFLGFTRESFKGYEKYYDELINKFKELNYDTSMF